MRGPRSAQGAGSTEPGAPQVMAGIPLGTGGNIRGWGVQRGQVVAWSLFFHRGLFLSPVHPLLRSPRDGQDGGTDAQGHACRAAGCHRRAERDAGGNEGACRVGCEGELGCDTKAERWEGHVGCFGITGLSNGLSLGLTSLQ